MKSLSRETADILRQEVEGRMSPCIPRFSCHRTLQPNDFLARRDYPCLQHKLPVDVVVDDPLDKLHGKVSAHPNLEWL